jgi:CreA protein
MQTNLPHQTSSKFLKWRIGFSKKNSTLFKTTQVVRFYDQKINVLIYLVCSDGLIEGSPKNSISTVPILKWQQCSRGVFKI